MGSKKPFLFLAGAIGLAILTAAILSRFERVPAPPEPTAPVPAEPTPIPVPTRDPEDFSTTRRLTVEEFRAYYDAMVDRASSYTTAQVRIYLSLPEFLEGRIVEAEIRFDAVRPDRWAKQIFASRPLEKNDPQSPWETLPRSGTLATDHLLREIEHDRRTAFEINFDATDEFLQPFFAKKREEMKEQFLNPYFDLMYKIPLKDRLREVVEAQEVKTSEGPEVRVLMRVNSVMSREISRGKLRTYFPICPDCAKAVSLREDVFAADTMEIKRINYLRPDRIPFLVQRYTQIVWDAPIPDDRFDIPLPEGSRILDIAEDQRRKKKEFDLLGEDWKTLDPEALELRKLLREEESR